MAVPFDTHETITRLEQAGFEPPQAEALSDVLRHALEGSQSQLATKLDLQEVKAELKADIAQVRTDMEKMRGELRTEIRDAKNSALTWTIGVLGTLYILGFGLLYTLIQRGLKP